MDEKNEKLTKFIFHSDNVLVETDKDSNAISRFTRSSEIVAADITDENSNSERYYYTQDEQGSTAFITYKNQSIKNEYNYDAFGNVLDSKEEVHNRITYTGQQFDGVTGQYYLRARFYNPIVGRFTQEDIYRGDGLNLYAYCGNNTVGDWNPSGYLCSKKINQYNKEVKEFKGNRGEYLRNKFNKGAGKTDPKYQVGAYDDIKGVEGLDAHHAGQKAVMKKLVKDYDMHTAPCINVPKIGHTIKGTNGIISRSTKGITSARQLLARDIKELRRVYHDIPNSKLQELIDMDKKVYPEMRK